MSFKNGCMTVMKNTAQQSALHSVVILTGSSLLLQVLGFLYRILLSRMLTSQQMGVYGLLMPVYAVLSAATLSGFSLAASRTTADYVGSRESRFLHGGNVLHASMRMYLLIFLSACFIFIPLTGGLSELLGESSLRTALLLLLPCLLMTAFENILKSVFQGLKNVTPSMISECSEQAVRIAAVGVLLSLADAKNQSGGMACALIVCGMMISEVASDLILGGFAGGMFRVGKSDRTTERQILRCALPVSAGNACGMLLASISATIIPTALRRYGVSGAEALAQYGELSGMLLPLLAIPGACIYPIFTVMLPRITEAHAAGNQHRFRSLSVRTIWAAAALGLCLEGMAVMFAPELCAYCFGKRYPAGSGQLLLLGVTTFLNFPISAVSCILNAAGKQGILVGVGLGISIIEVPLLYSAVAGYGLTGYAWVTLSLTILQAIILMGRMNKLLQ